jgi:hypothetical protein
MCHELAMPTENGLGFDDRGDFLQGLLPQLLTDLGEGLALAIRSAHTARDLVAQDAIFGHQVLVAQQQFLIDRPCNVCEQCLPIHALLHLCFFSPHSW